MADYNNIIFNRIVNDIQNLNFDSSFEQLQRLDNQLLGLARRMTAQDMGVESWNKLTKAQRESADTLATVAKYQAQIQKEAIESFSKGDQDADVQERNIALMRKRIEASGQVAASTEAAAKIEAEYARALREAGKDTEAIAAATERYKSQLEQLAAAEKAAIPQRQSRTNLSSAIFGGEGDSNKAATNAAIEESRKEVAASQAATTAVAEHAAAERALATATESAANGMRVVVPQNKAVEKGAQEVYLTLAREGKSLAEIGVVAKTFGNNMKQVVEVLKQAGMEIEGVGAQTNKMGNQWAENSRQMRGFRYGALEIVGAASMLTLAFGDQLPASAKQFEKSTMMMTSGGLAASFLNVNPIIGVTIGLFVALGVAAMNIDEKTQELDKHLEQLAKKDDLINTMARISGVSKEESTRMEELATKSSAYASALREYIDATREASGLELTLRASAEGWSRIFSAIGEGYDKIIWKSKLALEGAAKTVGLSGLMETGGKGGFDVVGELEKERAAKAAVALEQMRVQKAIQDTKEADEELAKESEDTQKAWQSSLRSTQKAWQDLGDNINKSFRTLQDSLAKADQSLNDTSAKAFRTMTEAKRNADRQMAESMSNLAFQSRQQAEKDAEARRKIEDSYNDAVYKAGRALNDKLADAARQRGEKITNIERDYRKSLQELDDDKEKRAYDLAQKLYEIERNRIQALADLDFNTALDLSKAKTENNKDEIQWRAMHEREVINRNAENSREDALRAASQAEADAAKKRRDLLIEYHYKKTVVEQEYRNETETAHRAYRNQVEDARMAYNDQMQAQIFNERQQAESLARETEVIKQHHRDAYDAAKQRYDDEIADAKLRWKEEREAAAKTYLESVQDAKKRYDEEIAAAKLRYDDEVARIKETWDAFLKKHNLTMQALQDERTLILSNQTQQAGFQPPPPSSTSGGGGGGRSGFGANGLDMIVPPGYTGDSYQLRVSSGEHVTVENAQNSGSQSVNITVEPMFAPMIQGLINKMIESKSFRDGVNIVLQDAVYQG